jgi:hypothetical protein
MATEASGPVAINFIGSVDSVRDPACSSADALGAAVA